MSAADQTKMPKAQCNVYLPPDLVKRIKHCAIDEGTSLSELVERALSHYLTSQGKEAR